MFYLRFEQLCNEHNETPSRVALNNGISKTSVTRWKNGAMPNSDIISKLATYFSVSTDYLLGKTDDKGKEPLSQTNKGITDDDIKFALFSGSDNITDEMYEEVKQFAEFVKQKYKK